MFAYSIVTLKSPFTVFEGKIGDNLSFFSDTHPIFRFLL